MRETNEVILASASPRRQELLRLLYPRFEVCVSQADERFPDGTAPDAAVELLALRKAQVVAEGHPTALVIGADTVVAVGAQILGKPRDAADAAQMLRLLGGRMHEVYTGVALCLDGRTHTFSCRTAVRFSPVSEREIDWYLATGEPFDKAGGYGIQGYGARFISGIEGDFYNVMGLPVHRLYHEIGEFNQEYRAGN